MGKAPEVRVARVRREAWKPIRGFIASQRTPHTNVRRSREAIELFYKVLYENQRSRPVEAVRVGVMRT